MGSFIDYLQEKRDGKSAKDKDYSLRDWFKGGGWKQAGGKYDGKPCAKQPGQKTKPYCRDADDRAKLSKKERNKRAAKKRREDPNPNRKGKAKMVKQESYSGTELNRLVEDKKKAKKDACYHKVKSRYKVWPSAYASGALVKCRKVGAKNWGNSTKKESYDFKSFAEFLTSQKGKDMSSRQNIKFNDSSRAASNRKKHVAEHGGEFVKNGRKWVWQETTPAPAPTKKTTKKKLF